MTTQVAIAPALLRWAIDRSRKLDTALSERFPKLGAWLSGSPRRPLSSWRNFPRRRTRRWGTFSCPSRRRSEFAHSRFQDDERDGGAQPERGSAGDAVCDAAAPVVAPGDPGGGRGGALGVVGSAKLSDAPEAVAMAMREALGLRSGWARGVNTWKDAISVAARDSGFGRDGGDQRGE